MAISSHSVSLAGFRMGTRKGERDPQRAAIYATALGVNTIVAAVPTRVICVVSYVVVCSNIVTITWQSGGGLALSGAMSFAANGGAAPPFSPAGHMETVEGESLVLNLSGAVPVGGHIAYVLL